MLKYNYKSLGVLNRFFKYRNDVDIFTEDNLEDKEFYRLLFRRLLKDSIKVNDITPLGCKKNVLNKYNQLKDDTSRRRIFIVDGDLELILKSNPKDNSSLFVLKSYCIENYLIEESASIELFYLNSPKEIDLIKLELSFEAWLNELKEPLIRLFINFAILRKIGGGPKLMRVNDFLVSKSCNVKVNIEKINDYSDTVVVDILLKAIELNIANPIDYFNTERNKLINEWGITTDTLLKIVSGKNYLLPALNFHIKNCIKGSNKLFSTKSFKMSLARFINTERLRDLKYHIENYW